MTGYRSPSRSKGPVHVRIVRAAQGLCAIPRGSGSGPFPRKSTCSTRARYGRWTKCSTRPPKRKCCGPFFARATPCSTSAPTTEAIRSWPHGRWKTAACSRSSRSPAWPACSGTRSRPTALATPRSTRSLAPTGMMRRRFTSPARCQGSAGCTNGFRAGKAAAGSTSPCAASTTFSRARACPGGSQ